MRKPVALLAAVLLAPATVALAQPADWQKTWDQALAAARKEGKVVIVGSPDPVMRNEVIPAFQNRYGIQVAYIAGGSGEIVGRMRVERSTGIYSVDVYMAGNDTTVNVLYPEKMIDPIRPLMILPETVGAAKWKAGKLSFIDPEQQYILRLFSTVTGAVFVNLDYVKPEELRSAEDLVHPRWKGKISTEDPTISGSGSNSAGRFYADMGPEFVKRLYIGQAPLISRDRRVLSDSLARGTHPICLTCRADDVATLQKSGFKLAEIFELEGMPSRIRPGPFLLTVANKMPNPNAAQVFVNWMAGKEALEIYSRRYEQATLRTDVDESHLDAHLVPQTGRFYPDDGDFGWISVGRRENTEKARALLKAR
jgi:iron(III) transport system substrate-binding protein